MLYPYISPFTIARLPALVISYKFMPELYAGQASCVLFRCMRLQLTNTVSLAKRHIAVLDKIMAT